MVARIGALGIVVLWAGMMSWLVWHDLWPAWTAQDPPRTRFSDLPVRGTCRSQVGVFHRQGLRIGAAWTVQTRRGQTIVRDDCLWIERFPSLPPTRIEVDSIFDADGLLDEIEAHVFGHSVALEFNGERFPREFAFEVKLGHRPLHTFKIPHSRAGAFGDMFRPFATLRNLKVGQAWRMQMFNPVAILSGFGETFTPLLVRVTGTETLVHDGAPVKCFVVQAGGSRALVGPEGVVYEQRVELPVGGVIVIRDEPYDAEYRQRVENLRLSAETEANRGS